MNKKCSNCGTENLDEARFCSECGSNLLSEPPSEQENNERPSWFPSRIGKASDSLAPQSQKEHPTSWPRRLVVTFSFLILIFLGIGSILVLFLHLVVEGPRIITVEWKKKPSYDNTIVDIRELRQQVPELSKKSNLGTDNENLLELFKKLQTSGILVGDGVMPQNNKLSSTTTNTTLYTPGANPSLYSQEFTADVFANAEWSRSDNSVSINTKEGCLHIGSNGRYDDFADKIITLTFPFVIETRLRLVSGGQNYTLPYLKLYWGPSSNQGIVIGYLPGDTYGWAFGPDQDCWRHTHTNAPVAENQWWTIKAKIDREGGNLFAKNDNQSSFSLVSTNSWKIPNQITKIRFVQPWDAVCDVDYITIQSAANIDQQDEGSLIRQLPRNEQSPINPNPANESTIIQQIGRPAIIHAPGVSSDNVAMWLTPVPYSGGAGRYYARHHASVQDGQRVKILDQVKSGQSAGTHTIKVGGMTYTFTASYPSVDDESLIETEDGVQGWMMTRFIKDVSSDEPQKYPDEQKKSQSPQLSSLPPNLTLDENVWYSGKWNSNIYNRSEKPKTVAIRLELVDAETGMPISGARVYLRGTWLEERIGTSGDEAFLPYQPQEREFALGAVSGRDGIVVFALSWEKEYPWHLGRPDPKVDAHGNITYYDVHSSWMRAVDDIEKVQYIEIRHPDFKFVQAPFNFSHLVEFGQNRNSESQSPDIFKQFDDAWHSEITKPGVKYCVLNLGNTFNDFRNNKSTRQEFFEMIKRKNFGTIYQQPTNWFSVGEYPQSECGPYFVYLLQLEIQRRSGQIDVNIRRQRE